MKTCSKIWAQQQKTPSHLKHSGLDLQTFYKSWLDYIKKKIKTLFASKELKSRINKVKIPQNFNVLAFLLLHNM